MKPVMQTIKGGKFSNCLQAATASFFELDLSEVPNFKKFKKNYWKAFALFAEMLGYESLGYIEGLPPEDGRYYMVHVDFRLRVAHAVIWKDGKIVHDPYGTGEHQDDEITGYYQIEKVK